MPSNLPRFLSRLVPTARSAIRDRRGNVGIAFALSMIPCAFVAGAAVDYSGAGELKSSLQAATDGTNLQLCKMATTSTQAQLQTAATNSLNGYMGTKPYSIDSITVTSNPRTIQLSTKATYKTAIVRLLNYRTVTVAATAKCFGETATFEIALVLDNTGSMSESSGGTSKLQALKTAATNFVNSISSDARLGPNTKMALVPFAAGVTVGTSYRSASWVDTQGKASYHWNIIQGGKAVANAAGATSRFDAFNQLKNYQSSWDWTGCFESLPYPLNIQDGAPSSSNPDSYYVPMFAPDESGDGGTITHKDASNNTIVSANSYLDDYNNTSNCPKTTDESTRTGQACKYVYVSNPSTSNGQLATGPNFSCTTRALTRLTTSFSTITNEISLMQANGNTDIHEGFMWGWRTLSPSSVFADGASYTKQNNNKIIILMTDGTNTWTANSSNVLKSYYSAYGFFKNPDGTTASNRMPTGTSVPTDSSSSRNAIDALTLAACANARAAGVTIYTIGFSVSSDPIDSQGISMLQSCAGSSDQSFVANDSTGIQTVFSQIASSIGGLRLTQ